MKQLTPLSRITGGEQLELLKEYLKTLDRKYSDHVVLLYSGKISGDSAVVASNITPTLGDYYSETYNEYKSFSLESNDGTRYRKLIFELKMPRRKLAGQNYNKLYVRYGIALSNCVAPFATVVDIPYNRQWSVNGTIDTTDGTLGVSQFNARINSLTTTDNPQVQDSLQSRTEARALPSAWSPEPITFLGFEWYGTLQGIPADTTLTLYGVLA